MHTRICAHCGERKTIQGVWYLVPPRLDDPEGAPRLAGGFGTGAFAATRDAGFLCEGCFVAPSVTRAPRAPSPPSWGLRGPTRPGDAPFGRLLE